MYLFDHLGKALRWLRDRRGKKQYEVAEEAGITKGMLCAYETGKQRPSLETLDKILHALDADLVTLHEALALVGRYGAFEITEAAAAARGGEYPLPTGGRDLVSDLPTETAERTPGLQTLVRQLLGVLQQFSDGPADPSSPPSPPRRR